jgi:hypothetical protein
MPIDLFAAPANEPMTPGDYLRLRREAAGLTIPQVATHYYKRPEHRADVEANLRTFELPHVKVKPHIAETLGRAFPFDHGVYRQLCEDPPELHPTLCRGCACDNHNTCHTREGSDCTITVDGICTACIEKVQAKAMRRAA